MQLGNAITLIALIITIIVLLILVGITLNLIIGNNGLFDIAEKATNEYKNSEKNEQEEIDKMIDAIDNSEDKNTIEYCIDKDISYTEEIAKKSDCLKPITFIPEKENWEFIGWREDDKATQEVLTEKITNVSIKLYAVFRQTITLSYNENGGSQTPENQIGYRYYNNGNIVNPKFTLAGAIIRDGYEFQKWRLNGDNGIEYNPNEEIVLEENAIMYANWRQLIIVSKGSVSGYALLRFIDGHCIFPTGYGSAVTGFSTMTGNTLAWNGKRAMVTANTNCSVKISFNISCKPLDGNTWYGYQIFVYKNGSQINQIVNGGVSGNCDTPATSYSRTYTLNLKKGETCSIRALSNSGNTNTSTDRVSYSGTVTFEGTPI